MRGGTFETAGSFLAGLGAGFAIGSMMRSKPFSFYGRTVVITGGSRGLGLLIARELAAERARLVLLARNQEELRHAEGELSALGASVLAIQCDVREQMQVDRAIHQAVQHFGSVDVLINNAGVIQVGPVDHTTVKDFEDLMAVHLYGPLYTTLAVVPHMRRAGGGRIVNISSIGGKIAVPHLLPYTASKFALVGLSDGFRSELRQDNILVTTVCPGLMRTGSPRHGEFKGQHNREYAWFAISDSLPILSMDARKAAYRVVEACRRGRARVILGAPAKGAVLVNELFPGVAAHLQAMMGRLLPRPDETKTSEVRKGSESESTWAPSILTRLSDEAALRNNETRA